MESENHPVWDLYNEYRTARLNTLYYGKQLTVLKRWNLGIEIVLATTAPTGIAGLWLWGTVAGGVIWKWILVIAASLAVIKPLVNLTGQIQQKSELIAHWRLHENDLYILSLLVKQHKSYDIEIQNRFISMMKAKTVIIQKEPTNEPNKKLQDKCYDQVNKELPFNDFFIPEE